MSYPAAMFVSRTNSSPLFPSARSTQSVGHISLLKPTLLRIVLIKPVLSLPSDSSCPSVSPHRRATGSIHLGDATRTAWPTLRNMPQDGGIQHLQLTHNEFNPSPVDIVVVRLLLQSVRVGGRTNLPPEIALEILALANYYPRLSSNVAKTCEYHADDFWVSGPWAEVAGLYLTSPPLPAVAVQARWITFQVMGADQGWADFGGHGTYHNSHTWYEASILRPVATSDAIGTSACPEDAITDTFRAPIEAREKLAAQGWDFVENRNRVVWKVHNNITACADYNRYRVDWVLGVPAEIDDPRATGDGENFLELLQPGDRVALWARAEVR